MNALAMMARRLRSGDLAEVLWNAKNYFVGTAATQALAVVAMPVFTRLMDREDYGIVAVYTATLGLLGTLSTLNAADGISRYYYEPETTDFGAFLSSIYQLIAVIQLPLVAVLLLFRNRLLPALDLPPDLAFFLAIGLISSSTATVFRQLQVSQKKSKTYAKVNVVQAYGGFAASVSFLSLLQGSGYVLRLAGQTLSEGLAFVWMFARNCRQVVWGRMSAAHIGYSLRFALPRLPYVLSGTILAQIDRIMIAKLQSVDQAGLYSVGYRVGSLTYIVIGAFTLAFMPNFYELMKNGKFAVVDQLNRQVMWVVSAIGIGLMLFGGVLLRLLAEEKFHDGAVVVPAVVLGYIFYALAGVYNRYSGYYKVTVVQSLAVIPAAVVNVGLNYWAIPRYGTVGAAYVTGVSYAVQSLMVWVGIMTVAKGHVTSLKTLALPCLAPVAVFALIECAR